MANKKSKLEISDLEALRLGGVYIPPFKMRRLQAKLATNKKSEAYQRLQWEALRKSINGPINKVNKYNITEIVVELFNENIIRGRGLFCRSIMKSQLSSPSFTNVYCALICIINTKIPEIGDLLCRRVLAQFQRSYKRNDKLSLKCIVKFIAHLINYQVLHELCGLQIIQLLLTSPTNDSIEIVKELVLNCGQTLSKLAKDAMKAIFNTLKDILQETEDIDIRVQYELESLFKAFKNDFAEHPAIDDELDLVDEDDIICHNIHLLGPKDTEKMLNIFKYDAEWDQHEKDYEEIKYEILGGDDDDEDEDSDSNSDEDDSESDDEDDTDTETDEEDEEQEDDDVEIADLTNENVMNLRRKIYLTIVSSLTAEEMGHKIMGSFAENEKHVSHMILESCSHERSYRKQYGLLAERLCKLRSEYEDCFDELFARQYSDAHILDTNKIRNVAKFFAHLLYSNALDWSVLEFIQLTERDTNSSKRIFIKILFQELASFMGRKLREQLFDSSYGKAFDGIFAYKEGSNPKDTRFSINFFTAIGLGGLTEEMRAFLKQKHKDMIRMQRQMVSSSDEDSSDSDSSSSDSSDSSDSTDTASSVSENDRDRRRKRTRRRKRRESRSRSRSRHRERRKRKQRRRNRSKSQSKSRSPSKSRSVSRGRWGV
eukprot:165587_1